MNIHNGLKTKNIFAERNLAYLGSLTKASRVKLPHEACWTNAKNVQSLIMNTVKNLKYKLVWIYLTLFLVT